MASPENPITIEKKDNESKFNPDMIKTYEVNTNNNEIFPDDDDSVIPPKRDPPKDSGGADDNKSKKLFPIAVIISAIVVGTIWGMYMTNTGVFDSNSEPMMTYTAKECQGILMTGKAIVSRNGGSEDYSTWDNKDDVKKIKQLETEFINHCTIDKEVVAEQNLNECTKTLIEWHTFVDDLPSKDKATWDNTTNEADKVFLEEYKKYDCNVIDEEVKETDAWKLHMVQRHLGEEP